MSQAWYCAFARKGEFIAQGLWYPSKKVKRGRKMTHSEAQQECDRRNADLQELELATSDILPDGLRAGASVVGRGSRT